MQLRYVVALLVGYFSLGTSAFSASCVIGQAVNYSADTFHVDNIVVPYVPKVGDIVASIGAVAKTAGREVVYSEYALPLFRAGEAGEIPRLPPGDYPHTIFINNMADTALVPDTVWVKAGDGRCAGEAKVTRRGTRSLEVTFTLRGGPADKGKGGLVFPRVALNSPNLFICSAAGTDILFAPAQTSGVLKGSPNTLCSVAGHAGGRVQGGKAGVLFAFVSAGRRQ